MTHRTVRTRNVTSTACILMLLATAAACANTQRCEQARAASAKAWQEVKSNATAQKLETTRDGKELSATELSTEQEVWSALERHAALLESSFKTPQITWRPAEKAQKALLQELSAYESRRRDEVVAAFRGLIETAQRAQATTDEACR